MTTTDSTAAEPLASAGEPPTGRPRVAWRPVLLIVAAVAVVHLAVADRYGWHHDEFYYVICGRHPDWGYVDQPPLTPLLARLAAALPGGVFPLRVLAIACEVACVVLAAMLAAEFGGRRRAQVITAAVVAVCPAFVGASLLFGTTVTDQVVWLAVFVLVARALRRQAEPGRGAVRAWLAVGVAAGIGLENKDTVAVLLVGLAVGLLVYRREVLRTPGPWLAGVIAVALAAPNLVWDGLHGWPNLQMTHAINVREGGALGSLGGVLLLFLVAAGPGFIVLWLLGARRLASAAGREHRWMLVLTVVAVVVFTASGGKAYYYAPTLVGLFAAGAVQVETGRRAWPARRFAVAVVATAVAATLVELPALPPSAASALRPVSPELMQTYGWPQFADQVSRAAATLPAGTPIFTSDYGEAGALTILGPAAGVHDPVYSGHNTYNLWGPPPGTPATVLCVGQFDAAYLHRFWSDVRTIAPVTLPGGLQNGETAQHAAIYLCRQPHGTWAQMWPGLRHID